MNTDVKAQKEGSLMRTESTGDILLVGNKEEIMSALSYG